MSLSVQRISTTFVCVFTFAMVLGVARGMERAQAGPIAAVIAVKNTNDSGPDSLRAAVAVANAADSIVFQLPVHSTITLTSGELTVTKTLTIDGSMAPDLALSGNNAS